MNQEDIGKRIKKIRKDRNMSQKEFASVIGVTYQAVSKWERGLNLPDMSTLNEICKKFNINIDDIINGSNTNTNKSYNKRYLIIISILIVLLLVGVIIIYLMSHNTYFTSDIDSTNNSFKVTGTFIKSNNKSSIIINNVNYEGDDDTVYKRVTCSLYEESGSTRHKVSECSPKDNSSLVDYLNNISIRLDHFSNKCSMFTNSNMIIQIVASDGARDITYNIPLKVDKCSNK